MNCTCPPAWLQRLWVRAAVAIVLGFLAPVVPAADEADATDTPRHEERVLGSSGEEYVVHMGGTLDSFNTRSPTRISSHPWEQAYQPMRLVRVENIGDTDIVNPWVEVNGRARWRTLDEIVDSALRAIGEPGTLTDAEKARALYEFHRVHRFHASPGDYENHDPVKMFNVYGYGLCGDSAPVLMELWRAAGLKTRRGFPMGHCTSEVWYDGAWHLLDGDVQTLVLRSDNTTVAGEEDLVRDHNLLRRMGGPFEGQAPLYTFVGTHSGEFFSHAGHTMNLTLRPGEALEWRWGDAQKHHYSADLDPETYMMATVHLRENWGPRAWALVENGKWVYEPPLRTPAGRAGAIAAENIRWRGDGDTLAATPEKPGQRASLTWKIEAPYVMVGGSLNARLRCSRADRCAFLFSEDGAEWQPIAEASGENAQIRASLDPYFPNKGPARYRYFLRLEMLAESNVDEIGIESIVMENDLQMAPLAMPTLQLGENRVRFVTDSSQEVSVRVTFDWVERSSAREPDPPAVPILPRDQSDIDGTRLTFQWEEARSNDAAAISDYHFQLSDRPDMRWALAANFDLTVSQTATRGTASFDLAEPGLLNPGQRYYWRVRAKTEKGVWGPWSRTWSFVPRGPGVPLHVQLRPVGDQYELAWEANPNGDRPAHYEIYASNEKGFRTSDAPYKVTAGNQPSQGLFPGQRQVTLPANHLSSVEASPLPLLPEHAFYRVVAVDAKGVRSGASDYAAAPRPFIYTKPPSEAKAHEELTYEAKTVVSIGDLTYRAFGANPDSYQLAYWDADEPFYTLLEEEPRCGHPDAIWASIDPKTGVLSGRPSKPAVYHINILVEIPGAGKHVQSFGLRVRE